MGLGDDVMAVGRAARMHGKSGRQVIIGPRGRRHWSPVFEHVPFLVGPNEDGTDAERLDDYPGHRPYIDYRKSTRDRQVLRQAFRAQPGQLFFTESEVRNARALFGGRGLEPGYVVVEPHVKGNFSGDNKRWPWGHWVNLVAGLKARGRAVVQTSTPGAERLPCVDHAISSGDVRLSLAIVAHAGLVVTTDGLFHHAAAALQVPTVVLWGARTNPMILGYREHVNLTCGSDWCGSTRVPCAHCADAMSRIAPERALVAVDQLASESRAESDDATMTNTTEVAGIPR